MFYSYNDFKNFDICWNIAFYNSFNTDLMQQFFLFKLLVVLNICY